MESENKKLVLNMLGGYALLYDGQSVMLGRGNLTKSVQLLQLILMHKDTGISKDELVSALYNWDDNDANNRLNSMIYRLKSQLIKARLPHEEYISIKNGICQWCGSMPVEVDTVNFEKYIEMASELTGQERCRMLEKALELYRGEFLPELSGELWVTMESMRLKRKYSACVNQLCDILRERQEYQRMLTIYRTASQLYPFDEWQEKEIECLRYLGRYDEAYRIYQKVVRLYSEELGATPSLEIQEQLQSMNEKLLNKENNFWKIREKMNETGERTGAYYCAYPDFVDTYRLMCRIIARNGEPVQLMMCSVHVAENDKESVYSFMPLLGTAIEKSIRRGDVYTLYSSNQYLILLPDAKHKDCEHIFRRIESQFWNNVQTESVELDYDAIEIGKGVF